MMTRQHKSKVRFFSEEEREDAMNWLEEEQAKVSSLQ
jgi:hypothetical protein